MTETLRPTDWRDLRVLYRNRTKGLYLDTARTLTRGGSYSSGVLRSLLSPAVDAFTWICADDCGQEPVLGQFAHMPEAPYARLTLLAPEEKLENSVTIDLLEQLAREAGERGAFHLLAEIPEESKAFISLRKAGFVVYARQRVWRLKEVAETFQPEILWKAAGSQDSLPAQSLYNSLVPGLVQQIELPPIKQLSGLVCHDHGEFVSYVDLKFGPRGIWAQPFIHPDTANVEDRFSDMLASISNRRSRPVYVCVRSYQAWLETALAVMDAEPGQQQAVMVKRLAAQHHVKMPFALPKIDGKQEITTPVAQSQRNS